ncbi:RNA polymerase sigma-70 factor [Streptomyces botrytidirepellens]|uniref:RNA polymerase sigma-70 factor n=1 Tax=Streptomyces botrytidirepellens TaxID=2486417 RepID=A0A3M8XC43_9ACTN|nr:RNA polymerase sigma-70 factor [Streptomyces botrytidirepellens]RNG38365.1 RNA polymerase sigma-70 factor [Streptomyces botrytidirepellens]
MIDATTFEHHRGMLFGIAYRMLGSVADAEDLVQDTWLRCSQVSTAVDNPAGYLTRTVTNLALNRLTSAAATREQYVGPWLPEPLVTQPDAAEEVELAESVSLAMLVVLDTLSPLERAVFVLKEVFGFSFREIAGMLERGEASVRQVGHRARSHVQARRTRYDTPAEVRRQVTDEFLAACIGGDINRMMELLAPDVTAWSDGGGKVKAALRPQRGADKVARFLAAVATQPMEDPRVHAVDVNGRPGLLLTVAGRPDTVACAEVVDGRITEIRIIRNPDKLRHL